MTRRALVLLFLLPFSVRAGAEVLFYGGDYNPVMWHSNSLSNENDGAVHGNPYGSAVYQNFVIPDGQTWNVTALFSNDLMTINPASAFWEIRTGVSEGNAGKLVASGAGEDSYQLKGTYGEYTNTVNGLELTMEPGTYWFTVVPEAPGQQGRSSITNTFGQNSIGTQISDQQYFDSPFYGYNFTDAGNIAVFPIFSSGVIGTVVPEPSSVVMMGTGVVAAVVGARRRRL